MTSFWALFKRRVVPIAFICAMAVLIQKTCGKQTRTHATIVLELGSAESKVKSVEAQLVVDGDAIGNFSRKALDGMTIGPCKFEVSMPKDDGQLTVDIETTTGKKHVVRTIHASEGATVSVPLAAELP